MKADPIEPDAAAYPRSATAGLADRLRRDDCLTPREVARRWRCRVSTVRAMLRRRIIEGIKVGRGVKILPESVARAEQGPLAAKPRRQSRKRLEISDEVRALLA